MKKFTPITKRCKLCGDTHTFTKWGEFWMCSCNSVGYDAGDEFMNRQLGRPEDMQTIATPEYFGSTFTNKVMRDVKI